MEIRYLIYPAVGVARIGPANEFFYGPEQTVLAEVAGQQWQPERQAYPPSAAAGTNKGKFRSAAGEILRQAARFRVYKVTFKQREFDGITRLLPHAAELVNLKAAGVDCQWKVSVANKKSFTSLARPAFNRNSPAGRIWNEAQATVASNSGFAGGTKKLEGSHTIAGGKYMLAEIFTDDEGRLVVLAGKGRMDGPAATPPGGDLFNKDWFDDVCDGSVECTLKIGGVAKTVERAWIVTGPPKFAASIPAPISLYDIAISVASERKQVRFPTKVSFERDVYPIFETVLRQQPVSLDAVTFHTSLGHAIDWAKLGKVADSASVTLRKLIGDMLQKPSNKFKKRAKTYAEAADEALGATANDLYVRVMAGTPPTPLHYMPYLIGQAYSSYQLRVLHHWASGDFSEYTGAIPPAFWKRPAFDALPALEQLDALNLAHMGSMLGTSTIPGIEVCYRAQKWDTWHDEIGFRVAPSLKPGELSEGLSVPWPDDYHSCYRQAPTGPSTGPNTPRAIEWWPSHRPLVVLEEGKKFPAESVEWDRDWELTAAKFLNWKKLGFINLESDVAGGMKWRREHERG